MIKKFHNPFQNFIQNLRKRNTILLCTIIVINEKRVFPNDGKMKFHEMDWKYRRKINSFDFYLEKDFFVSSLRAIKKVILIFPKFRETIGEIPAKLDNW